MDFGWFPIFSFSQKFCISFFFTANLRIISKFWELFWPVYLWKILLKFYKLVHLALAELSEIATCNDSVDLSPNNPFMETQDRDTPLDIALQTLQVLEDSLMWFRVSNNLKNHKEFSILWDFIQLDKFINLKLSMQYH